MKRKQSLCAAIVAVSALFTLLGGCAQQPPSGSAAASSAVSQPDSDSQAADVSQPPKDITLSVRHESLRQMNAKSLQGNRLPLCKTKRVLVIRHTG